MRKIPYDPEDVLSINVFLWCEAHGRRRAFMLCPTCDDFPCGQLTAQDIGILKQSPLMDFEVAGLHAERRRLVILVKKTDGTIEESGMDINHPDLEQLKDVEEVYVINKVLVPTIVLRPKPKEERDKIVAQRRARKRAASGG